MLLKDISWKQTTISEMQHSEKYSVVIKYMKKVHTWKKTVKYYRDDIYFKQWIYSY